MIRYELTVAVRYLTSNRLQTALILAGIAVGILSFTFMAALINGLAVRLTDDVVGNLAHVTLEPPDRVPRLLGESAPGERALVVVQQGNERRPRIDGWRRWVAALESIEGVRGVSPQVNGSGFLRRGEKVLPISLVGVEPDRLGTIVDLEGQLVAGTDRLSTGFMLLGVGLAEEFGLVAGQRVRLSSERGRDRSLVLRGIFDVGSGSLNERVVFLDLGTAQSLLELEGGISRIELKLDDIYAAPSLARRTGRLTGLEAKDWISQNERLQGALDAQGRTGSLIKLFSMLTIIIAVAAVLLLSAVRRRAEIGILRSFGTSKISIGAIFLLQGLLLGAVGSSLGAGLGWGFSTFLAVATRDASGDPALPVDPAQGEYALAICLATFASAVAALLPARSAASIDPVEVIQN